MRTLVVGDIHEPVAHPGYLPFCCDLRDKYKCDKVVFIGDLVDWHAISFHTKHPEAPGPKDEYELSKAKIAQWFKAFPVADVCIGNHDERVIRVAEEAGIPSMFLRYYGEVWETPTWNWLTDHTHDDVYYFHGTGAGGMHPSFNSMKKMLMSVVQGHIHSAAGVKWCANPTRRIFGMDTGCGIDDKAYAFAYGKHQKVRSVLGAGVVIDGIPHHEIMPIGPGEKYHRSRFKKEADYEKSIGRRASKALSEIMADRQDRTARRESAHAARRKRVGLPEQERPAGRPAKPSDQTGNRQDRQGGRRRPKPHPES